MSASEETVYTAAGAAGGHSDTYHVDPDCRALAQARNVHEWPLAHVEVHRDACTECAGEEYRSAEQDRSLYQAAAAAEPEVVSR